MEKQFNVFASITAKEGKLAEVKQVLAALAIETRKESGNISYQVLEDTTKPNTVFSIEQWENTEAEAAHFETAHIKIAFEKMKDLMAAEPIMYKGYEIV